MHCMLMDLLHGFEVLSTTEETLFNSQTNYAKPRFINLYCRTVVPNQGSMDPQGVREKLAGGPRVHWHLTKLIYNIEISW